MTHHRHNLQQEDENDLKLCIAGTEGEVWDSHKGRQERLNVNGDDDDEEKDDGDDVEEEDDGDLDVVLESVGNQGLAEEGRHASQHPRS